MQDERITFGVGTASSVVEDLHRSAEDLRAHLLSGGEQDSGWILSARFEGDVVGYLAASVDEHGGLVVWEHLVVPEFRNRGIGRRLLLEAARRAPPMAKIVIDPVGDFAIDRVAAYYSKFGFPATGQSPFSIAVRAHEVVDAVDERVEEQTAVRALLRKNREVIAVDPDAIISAAVELMSDMSVGALIVSRDGRLVEGILSERDVVVGLHNRGSALLDGVVSEYMSRDVVTVEAGEAIAHVVDIATTRRLRHVPVTDSGKLIGVVSVGDLLAFRMREHDMRRTEIPHRQI